MFDRLRRQVEEFLCDDLPKQRHLRPGLEILESRLMPSSIAGQILNLFFDGSYGNDPYGAQSATAGLSAIDTATGATSVIYEMPAVPTNDFYHRYEPGNYHLAQTGDGRPLLFDGRPVVYESHGSTANGTDPYATNDDGSTISIINPGGSPVSIHHNRETLAVAKSTDGKLVVSWFDAQYGSNPYGADSASTGLSLIDPASGAEQLLLSQPVAGYPLATYAPKPLAPVLKVDADGQPLTAKNRWVLVDSRTGRAGASTVANSSRVELFDPASQTVTGLFDFSRQTLEVGKSPDGNLLVKWENDAYSFDPYAYVSSSSVGVSRLDPLSGADTAVFSRTLHAPQNGEIDSTPWNIQIQANHQPLLVNGRQIVTFSESGQASSTNPYDDRSSVYAIDASGSASLLATDNRELRSLGTTDDGKLVLNWFDGHYGTNPYGPESASTGLSRLDPLNGVQTPLANFSVPYLPYHDENVDSITENTNPKTRIVLLGDNFGHLKTFNGKLIAALTTSGAPPTPGNATPYDASSLYRIPTDGTGDTLLRNDGRDVKSLGLSSDGGILVDWFSGQYNSTDPYGPVSGTHGVSRIDPASGVESSAFQEQVTDEFDLRAHRGVALLNGANGFPAFSAGRPIGTFVQQGFGGDPPLDDATRLRALSATGTAVNLYQDSRYSIAFFAPSSAPALSAISNQTVASGPVGPLAFTLTDDDTPNDFLTLSASSSNPALLPAGNVVLGGSGSNRTITLTPVAGQSGSSTITITASDGSQTTTRTFQVVVASPPTLADIANVAVNQAGTVGPLPLTLGDLDTPVADLTVTAVSSNTALVPAGSITFGGSGANRTLTIHPASGQSGNATITVTVSDGTLSTTKSFALTVTANSAPTITPVVNQKAVQGSIVGPLPLMLGDVESSAGALTLAVTSSNAGLVPASNVSFGGSGANRTITVKPVAGQVGSADLTVTVQDTGGRTSTTNFTVAVAATGPAAEFSVGSDAGVAAAVTYYDANRMTQSVTNPFGTGFTGGIRTVSADVTGDGVADLIVASGPGIPGEVIVFDGKTNAVLFTLRPFGDTFKKGVNVSAGDMTGDAKAEIIITAETGGGARVRIFTPTANGFDQKADFFGLVGGTGIPDDKFRGGGRATIGDLNGDGIGDIIFAAGAGGGPRIAIFDGSKLTSTGGPKLVGDFYAFESNLRNGSYIAAGDVDGDGLAEIIAGAGPGGGPRVSVYDGAALLRNSLVKRRDFFAGNVDNRGGIRVAVKNLDKDALADLLVGSGPGGTSSISAYYGTTLGGGSGAPPTAFGLDPYSSAGVYVG